MMKKEKESTFTAKPERCSLCKGNINKGKTDLTLKKENVIISVKEIPAFICENCGEAYFTPEVSRKLDDVMSNLEKGELLAHPLAAGEIEFDKVA